MKHWKLLIVCMVMSAGSYAQSITYKVIKDQPDDCANYWINVGLFDMGFATKNKGYGLLGYSLNSVVQYKNKVGGELTYRSWYLSLADFDKTGRNFEIGGFYNLFSKTKTKNQRVILSSKSKYVGGKTYTETMSMKVPGTIMRSYGVRAGFNSQSGAVDGEKQPDKDKFTGTAFLKSGGLYAGILITGQMNLKTHTSEYGIRGFGVVRRTYIDLLFNPIRSLEDANGVEVPNITPGAIGFRFGMEFMQPEPKKVQGNAIYQKFEFGSRPMNGYYFLYSVGFNFKRKVKAMSSFVPVREME